MNGTAIVTCGAVGQDERRVAQRNFLMALKM